MDVGSSQIEGWNCSLKTTRVKFNQYRRHFGVNFSLVPKPDTSQTPWMQLSDRGMELFTQNCKGLKNLFYSLCMFEAGAMNAALDYCIGLKELSIKCLRGLQDAAEPIDLGAAAYSLKSICLKDLINGQCFEPLIIDSKNLRTLKLIHCLGEWDKVLGMLGNFNPG